MREPNWWLTSEEHHHQKQSLPNIPCVVSWALKDEICLRSDLFSYKVPHEDIKMEYRGTRIEEKIPQPNQKEIFWAACFENDREFIKLGDLPQGKVISIYQLLVHILVKANLKRLLKNTDN